jgi:hypothetical protein
VIKSAASKDSIPNTSNKRRGDEELKIKLNEVKSKQETIWMRQSRSFLVGMNLNEMYQCD